MVLASVGLMDFVIGRGLLCMCLGPLPPGGEKEIGDVLELDSCAFVAGGVSVVCTVRYLRCFLKNLYPGWAAELVRWRFGCVGFESLPLVNGLSLECGVWFVVC